MKKINILVFLVISSFFSCAQSPTPKDQDEVNETPKALQEKKIVSSDINYSNKFRYDLIDKLFKEAMDNNAQLKSFYKSINKQHVKRNNQLDDYYKYIQMNEQYWENTNTYINQISDSTLKAETSKEYDFFLKQYQSKIKSHKERINQIGQLTIDLNDQIILLKLSVTQSMMMNYQTNELLDINITDDLITAYTSLIERTKELENQAALKLLK